MFVSLALILFGLACFGLGAICSVSYYEHPMRVLFGVGVGSCGIGLGLLFAIFAGF